MIVVHALTHSSRSLNDRWGIKDDRATTFLHSSLPSAFGRASPNHNPVHSDNYIISHLFNYMPFLFPPCTVPGRIIFASPIDLVMCPYRLNLRFLKVVIRSSYGPVAFPDSVPHFFIRNMIPVGDAQKSLEASHFCSLYLPL